MVRARKLSLSQCIVMELAGGGSVVVAAGVAVAVTVAVAGSLYGI